MLKDILMHMTIIAMIWKYKLPLYFILKGNTFTNIVKPLLRGHPIEDQKMWSLKTGGLLMEGHSIYNIRLRKNDLSKFNFTDESVLKNRYTST